MSENTTVTEAADAANIPQDMLDMTFNLNVPAVNDDDDSSLVHNIEWVYPIEREEIRVLRADRRSLNTGMWTKHGVVFGGTVFIGLEHGLLIGAVVTTLAAPFLWMLADSWLALINENQESREASEVSARAMETKLPVQPRTAKAKWLSRTGGGHQLCTRLEARIPRFFRWVHVFAGIFGLLTSLSLGLPMLM